MAAPVFNSLDDTPTFNEGGAAVILDNTATVTDPDLNSGDSVDGATLVLARVGGASDQDLIESPFFDEGQYISPNSSLVVGFATLSSGTLTVVFNADATLADVTSLIQSLNYANASSAPPPSVQIGFTFNNGDVATGSITVTINAVNSAPTLDNVTSAAAYSNGTPLTLSPAIAVADADNATLTGATVAFSAADATDSLSASVGSTGIVANYAGGVLTLSGTATIEQYRQVLSTVAYSSSAPDPTFGGTNNDRTLSWTVTDGTTPSNISNTIVEFATVLDLDASAAGKDFAGSYVGANAAVAIADTDSQVFLGSNPLLSLAVVLTNAQAGDTLSAPGAPGAVTVDTSVAGQITLAINLSFASAATAEQAVESVRFSNANANLDATPRQFNVQLQDAADYSNTAHATLNITANGSSGDDTFNVPVGTSAFNGGTGIDTVNFGFRLIDATVTYSGNSIIIDSASSHTVLTGVERFAFADGAVDNADGNPLVDDLFYYSRYHDVWNAHVDADAHYNASGWHENRDPNAFFSTSFYLLSNSSVKAANINPLIHFDSTGWKAGSIPSLNFDPAAYLAAYPDVKAAGIDPLAHFLQNGAQEGRLPIAPTELLAPNGFDYIYYLKTYTDVAAAGVDPFQHFQAVGWKEGRNPNALFDTAGYLATYGDVKAAGVNPLDHYHTSGWLEGRDPSVNFDTSAYLAAYADVAAAHVDPLTHYLDFGRHEGRSAFADGIWG